MKPIVFATRNENKVKEINIFLGDSVPIISLNDIGCTEELPETSPTIKGNALEKARYVYQNYQADCFAEDSGLEVDALGGAPGVHSAYYAGPSRDAEANMNLLLSNLQGKENRSARFRTVIALILDGEEHTFEGIVNGTIIHQKKGQQGFGYDPVFLPDEDGRTFAQMTPAEKNKISHRGRAATLLRDFLLQNL